MGRDPKKNLTKLLKAMEEVRAITEWVSSHVTINLSGIEKVAESMKNSIPKVEWDYK